MNPIQIYTILLAGGSGTRLNQLIPKQLIIIQNKPLILYSFEIFYKWYLQINFAKWNDFILLPKKIVIVSNKDYISSIQKIMENFQDIELIFTAGGESRHDSTKEGLKQIEKEIIDTQYKSLILIHDSARPIFLIEELNELILTMIKYPEAGIASLAATQSETLVQIDAEKDTLIPLNRKEIYSVKTPQILSSEYVSLFLQKETKPEYTDLLTWGWDNKIKSQIVEIKSQNIKITYPEDIEYFEFLLNKMKNL